jgi:hypothetical protein
MSKYEKGVKLEYILHELFHNRFGSQVSFILLDFKLNITLFFEIESWHRRNTRVLLKTTLFIVY